MDSSKDFRLDEIQFEIQQRLKDVGLVELIIPIKNHIENVHSCTSTSHVAALGSRNWRNEETMLLVLNSSRVGVEPGIWSRSLLLSDGTYEGSMVPFYKLAIRNGFGVLSVWKAKGRHDLSAQAISLWQALTSQGRCANILIYCHRAGAEVMLNLLCSYTRQCDLHRIKAIAFCEASLGRMDIASDTPVGRFISNRAIHFRSDASIAKGDIVTDHAPCVSLSMGDIRDSKARTNLEVTNPVFNYFTHMKEARTFRDSLTALRKDIKSDKAESRDTTDTPAVSFSRTATHSQEQLPVFQNKRRLRIDDFKILKFLGRGSIGRVLLVRYNGNGCLYAMKILKKAEVHAEDLVELVRNESFFWRVADHPFIARLRFSFQSQSKLFLVMDYCAGGEIYDHCINYGSPVDESLVRIIAAQIVLAIKYIHEKDCVYRDLKPENVLVDEDGFIKLVDFGAVKLRAAAGAPASTLIGSMEYMAPDMIRSVTSSDTGSYGKEIDWWSFGVLLHELLAGQHPFRNDDDSVMISRIMSQSYVECAIPSFLSFEATSLLRGLMQIDPKARLGYKGAAEVMGHAFFKDLDWDAVYGKKSRAFSPLQLDKDGQILDHSSSSSVSSPEDFSECSSTLTQKSLNAKGVAGTFEGFTYIEEPIPK